MGLLAAHGRHAARALAAATAIFAGAHCSLGAGGADYAAAGPATGGSADAASPDAGDASDARPAATVPRALLLGGDREPFGANEDYTFLSEVLATPLDPPFKTWERMQPPLLRGWFAASLFDRTLVLDGDARNISSSALAHVVQWATVDAAGPRDWSAMTVPANPLGYMSRILTSPKTLLAVGGRNSSSVYVGEVHSLALDLAAKTAGTWSVVTGVTLTPKRGDPSLVTYKQYLYVVYGRDATGTYEQPEVEVATLDPNGIPGPMRATEPLVDGSNRPLPNSEPGLVVANGALWVIGGRVTYQGAPSDSVVYARINEADGSLAKWTAGPKLPAPLREAGIYVHAGTIYVAGGAGVTARSDAVLSLAVNQDGTPNGTWQTLSQKLPTARAAFGAVVLP
jgi:hypothetical protein